LRVFAEKRTGRTAERPELQACLDYLRPGDTLVAVMSACGHART